MYKNLDLPKVIRSFNRPSDGLCVLCIPGYLVGALVGQHLYLIRCAQVLDLDFHALEVTRVKLSGHMHGGYLEPLGRIGWVEEPWKVEICDLIVELVIGIVQEGVGALEIPHALEEVDGQDAVSLRELAVRSEGSDVHDLHLIRPGVMELLYLLRG